MNYLDVERNLKSIGNTYGKPVYNFIPGNNWLSNNIAGVYKLSGHDILVELSYGRGMGDYYIYGVTFADGKGANRQNYQEFNKCCHEFSEVKETIDNILEKITE